MLKTLTELITPDNNSMVAENVIPEFNGFWLVLNKTDGTGQFTALPASMVTRVSHITDPTAIAEYEQAKQNQQQPEAITK